MGKRKNRSGSEKSDKQTKTSKVGDPSEGVGVSEILQSSRSVLYSDVDDSVFETEEIFDMAEKVAPNIVSPNSEILLYLKKIDNDIGVLNSKFDKIVDKMEGDIKNLYVKIHDSSKDTNENIFSLSYCIRIQW